MSSSTSKFKSTPTWTLKSRTQLITKSNQSINYPSPQTYNPENKQLIKKEAWKFPKNQRFKVKKQAFPCPGSYQYTSYIDEGSKKSFSSKLLVKIQVTPGPGEYEANQKSIKIKAPIYSFPNKTKSLSNINLQKNHSQPWPGKYQTNISTLELKKKSVIQKTPRFKSTQYKNETGPGTYNSEQWKTQSIMSKKGSLNQAERDLKFSFYQKTPGPAAYTRNSLFEENEKKEKGFKYLKQNQVHVERKSPGPGAYESPLEFKFKSSTNSKISPTKRKTFLDQVIRKASKLPGPGDHQSINHQSVKYQSSFNHKFSKSKKLPTNLIHPKLSPFSYADRKDFKSQSSPKFSFCKESTVKQPLNKSNPGPTNYNPKSQSICRSPPKYKIPAQKRLSSTYVLHSTANGDNFPVENLSKTPGPGHYTDNTASSRLKHKFGKDQRFSLQNLMLKNTNKSVSFQPRQKFPNPPNYMNVQNKYLVNLDNLKKY